MYKYVVSYDLRIQRDYSKLSEALRKFPNWGRVTESTWLVSTTWAAKQVADYLVQHMDSDDRLFVIETTNDAAWRNVICETDWLRKAV